MVRKRTTRRRYTKRRNPAVNATPRRRTYRRRARRAASRIVSGLAFKAALKNAITLNIGMFAAKAAARRFGLDSSETNPESWTWRSYIQAGLGGAGAALLFNAVKPGKGQKVLEGALAFTLFKMLQNELVVKNETATKWFGADDEEQDPNLLNLDLEGIGADDDEELVYVDDNGQEIPMSDEYRMQGLGSVMLPVGRMGGFGGFGDAIATPGPLGNDSRSQMMDAYRASYSRG